MFGSAAAYLLRTTAVLTLALLAAAAARRRPAALRHFILSSALAGLLLLPLLSLLPVGWGSPVLPPWMAASGPGARDGAGGARQDAITEAGNEYNLQHAGPAFGAEPGFDGSPAPSLPLPNARGVSLPGAAAGPSRRAVLSGSGFPDLIVSVVWPAGLLVLLLRLLVGLAGAVRLTRQGTPLADPAWRVLLERIVALVSLRRPVRLKTHPEVLVPLTWGWRRPVVLFPAGAGDWPAEERSSALLHELAHVKRADFLAMVLVRTSLALFWWNPLCWVVYSEILKAQEIACDELVLRAGIRPSTYAASLLAFRRSAGLGWNPSAALPGMLGRSSFQERLAAILKHKLILMEVKMKTKIMLAVVLVLTVALVGTARPVAGNGSLETAAILAEMAAPQEKPAEAVVVQEKEKKVVKAKDGNGYPIVITITNGDVVKTLTLDKPLTITRGKDGDTLVLSVNGKDLQVLKGEPLHLEIKGGELQILNEGNVMKIGESPNLKIVKEEGDEGRAIVYSWTARPEVVAKNVKVVKKGEPEFAWTIKEGDKEGLIFAKEFSGKPYAFATGIGNKAMLEKVRALQEQVQAVKAKKLDIAALEESLKKLEAELKAKEEKIKEIGLKFDEAPGEFSVVKRLGGDKSEGRVAVWVSEKDEDVEADEAGAVRKAIVKTGKGTFDLILIGEKGDEGKKAFELALAKLKKELPEGYKLAGQEYDAAAGSMTFKIATPEGKGTDPAVVKKLVESLKETIKTGK
jgi:beta-lactamase regulating signal transducer with metallopeptidase domain